MSLSKISTSEGITDVLQALVQQPRLVGFLGALIAACLISALFIFRKHRLRYRSDRMTSGAKRTSISVEPIKYLPPIDGFEAASVEIEAVSQKADDAPRAS